MNIDDFKKSFNQKPMLSDEERSNIVIDMLSLTSPLHKQNLTTVMEEMAELIQVIIENDQEHMLEEIADVTICVWVLEQVLNIRPTTPQPVKKEYTYTLKNTLIHLLATGIQKVSKFVRADNNVPRKDPNKQLIQLSEYISTLQYTIQLYMKKHRIAQQDLECAINVKLLRQRERNNNNIK